MFESILVAHAVWFGLGFHLFSLRNRIFAKILVPREPRDTPVFHTLAATGPFLGGFNLAFFTLNLLLVFNTGLFPEQAQRVVLLVVIALAHGSQFFANVPVAIENYRGGGVWRVSGLMRFIFVTDFILMCANFALAIVYWS